MERVFCSSQKILLKGKTSIATLPFASLLVFAVCVGVVIINYHFMCLYIAFPWLDYVCTRSFQHRNEEGDCIGGSIKVFYRLH